MVYVVMEYKGNLSLVDGPIPENAVLSLINLANDEAEYILIPAEEWAEYSSTHKIHDED